MSVEFITADTEATKQIESLYLSARKQGYANDTWAVFGQVYWTVAGVRVKAILLDPKWAAEIKAVFARMQSAKKRRKKRAPKAKRASK